LDSLLTEIDEDKDGEIDFDEFKKMMEYQMKVQNTESEVEKAFAIFDPNNTGYINAGMLTDFSTERQTSF
jgi:calcium-binding protein CML